MVSILVRLVVNPLIKQINTNNLGLPIVQLHGLMGYINIIIISLRLSWRRLWRWWLWRSGMKDQKLARRLSGGYWDQLPSIYWLQLKRLEHKYELMFLELFFGQNVSYCP